MHERQLVGIIAFSAPPLVWVAAEISGYEWIWNRTSYSIATGFVMAVLSFVLMAIGLKFILSARKKILGRTILLGGVIFSTQLFNIGLDGFAQMSGGESIGDGRKAFSLRYAAFGKSWTDVYITHVTWCLLRKTEHVHQYDGQTVARLQASPDGYLEVHVAEFGKPERVDRYSPGKIKIESK